MRIGLFTDTYPPMINGVSTSILMLRNELKRQGHEVFVITINDNKTKYDYDKFNGILKIPSLPIHKFDFRLSSIYPIRAIKIVKEMKLDIIHSHTEFTIGMFARVISNQLNIPVVHTYHTKWEDYVHYVTKGNEILNKPSKEIVKYLTIFFGDKTITELIVPSKKIYKLFNEKYNITKNVHIVPTGIEIDNFSKENFSKIELEKLRKDLGFNKKDFIVLSLSRLAKEKSVDKIIENHKKIVKLKPNIKLLIVGDGPDTKYLKDLAKEMNLEKSIIFSGKVPFEKVPKYYQISNLFVTSSTTETQGLTVLEAMASSLPVVAIKDESFEDAVINNLNGYLYSTDEEYINYIIKLYENKELYKHFSRESKILVSSFSSKYYAERVLEVYKIAIENFNSKTNILKTIKNIIDKGKKILWKR